MLLFGRNSPILPNEYTKLDYIESSGTQYINTELQLFNSINHEIIIDFEPTSFYNYNSIFGSTLNADTFEGWIYINGGLAMRYNDTRYGPDNGISINSRHLIDLKKEGTTLSKTVDNVLLGTGTVNTRTTDANFLLFLSGSDYGKYKLYSCKLYRNDVLERYYIPCMRKSDKEVGLYDLVTDVFYINEGTGSFIAGTKSCVTPKKIMYIDKLPNEYTRLNYIQNSGTQYIDTGYIPNYDKDIKVEIETTPTVTNRRYCLLSNYIAYKHLSLELQSDKGRAYYNNGVVDKFAGTLSTTEKNTYIFEYDTTNKKYNLTVNGVSVNGDMNATGISSSSMLIFVDQYKRFSTFANPLRIYNVKITENDILIRNLVPCIRKTDDEIGMYDLVNKVFYTNAGTGTFTAGDEYEGVNVSELIYNGTVVWRGLPSNFERLKYITGDGSSYIDTGKTLGSNFEINVEFMRNRTVSHEQPIISTWSSGYNYWNLFLTSNGALDLYADGHMYPKSTAADMNTLYTATVKRNDTYFEVSYNEGSANKTTRTLTANQNTLKILNRGDLNGISYCSVGKVTVKDNERIILDLVPCKRKSDNEVGMYDLITKTFYTNAGSGSFIAGE